MLECYLGEPHQLQRVIQVARRLGSDMREDLRHACELHSTLGRCGFSQFAHVSLIAADVGDHCLKRDHGGTKKVVLGLLHAAALGLGKNSAVAARQHAGEIADDVSLTLVGLRDGENLGFLSLEHLGVGMLGIPVVERPTAPEGIQHLAIVFLVIFGHIELVLRTNGKLVQLIQNPVRGHLGRDDTRPRLSAAVTHQQVIIVHDDLMVREQMFQGPGATNHGGLPLRLLIALHIERRALQGNLTVLCKQTVFDCLGALGKHLTLQKTMPNAACFVLSYPTLYCFAIVFS